MFSVIARNPSPCADTWYGNGGTGVTQPVLPADVRIFTLFDSINGAVCYWYCVYFHLGAMHWDSADTPLSGTRDPTGELCGYPSVGPTGMGTLRLSLLGTLWLSLCHPLLSCP